MRCTHCGEPIGNTEAFCKAGPNDSVFCARKCAHQALKKFYTKYEINKSLNIITQSSQHHKK